jgi:hypothetical protein
MGIRKAAISGEMALSFDDASTEVRLGCESCPQGKTLQFPDTAGLHVVTGVDTSGVPIKVSSVRSVNIDRNGHEPRVVARISEGHENFMPSPCGDTCQYAGRIAALEQNILEHVRTNIDL